MGLAAVELVGWYRENGTVAIYLFTNFLWTLNLYISNAVGYLIQQAYDLDFISSAASEIGKNIQLIAGVSASGFDSTGLFPGMMAIVTLLVGVYCTYVGLVKRETTKAFHAALNFVVVFVVSGRADCLCTVRN